MVSKKNIYTMISELKDDDILEFLMTSEFEDESCGNRKFVKNRKNNINRNFMLNTPNFRLKLIRLNWIFDIIYFVLKRQFFFRLMGIGDI